MHSLRRSGLVACCVIIAFLSVSCRGATPFQERLTAYRPQTHTRTAKKRDLSPTICVKKLCHHKMWWVKLAEYLKAKHDADVAAWLAAMSFPPLYLRPVLQCIKDHESGNYAEGNGAGAYQIIGPTWRTWSPMAGYPGYSEASYAPGDAQDHVAVYMIQHGGAHNWDPSYGDDPCTVNLP